MKIFLFIAALFLVGCTPDPTLPPSADGNAGLSSVKEIGVFHGKPIYRIGIPAVEGSYYLYVIGNGDDITWTTTSGKSHVDHSVLDLRSPVVNQQERDREELRKKLADLAAQIEALK